MASVKYTVYITSVITLLKITRSSACFGLCDIAVPTKVMLKVSVSMPVEMLPFVSNSVPSSVVTESISLLHYCIVNFV